MSDQLDRRLVAVMFTDMVGYTALMQADERLAIDKRDRYVRALERHHDAFGGTIVQRLGDGSMSMFSSSLDAVLAAVAIQQELGAQDVPTRIGVHVGEVLVEPERLTGDAVNVAARIESFSVPGGVLLSDSAYEQIKNRTDVGMVRLGRFRLKNVGRPFELFAVSADGVVVPDPEALDGKGGRFASLPSNLPEPVTPLVGRAADVSSLIELVRDHRVVTITGPGGVGKALLLLDNLEQVVEAAPEVGWLAERCPGLRIVTTSRTPLRIAAEREYPLAPLELPPISDPVSTVSLMAYAAVALFVDRARTTRGSFELTPENAGAVAAVCRRLDGLPLALELAAARLRLLSPDSLLERLDRALDVLTSGTRDIPERQRTLRATIDWSHSLLTASEQQLFRRMAVFAGGSTLADLEAVGETCVVALRQSHRYAELAREIRDGIESTDQIGSLERGIAEEGNLQAALDTLLAAARGGDAGACEVGMQLCGDLWMYWHIRGKNLTAREYAGSFLEADAVGSATVGRAGALLTAGLASWVLGQFERTNDEWAEAYRIAAELEADRELCLGAFVQGLGLLGFDLEAGLRWTREGIERSRGLGFTWAEGLSSTVDGILHTVAGDVETAQTRYSEALEIQQRIGDEA